MRHTHTCVSTAHRQVRAARVPLASLSAAHTRARETRCRCADRLARLGTMTVCVCVQACDQLARRFCKKVPRLNMSSSSNRWRWHDLTFSAAKPLWPPPKRKNVESRSLLSPPRSLPPSSFERSAPLSRPASRTRLLCVSLWCPDPGLAVAEFVSKRTEVHRGLAQSTMSGRSQSSLHTARQYAVGTWHVSSSMPQHRQSRTWSRPTHERDRRVRGFPCEAWTSSHTHRCEGDMAMSTQRASSALPSTRCWVLLHIVHQSAGMAGWAPSDGSVAGASLADSGLCFPATKVLRG